VTASGERHEKYYARFTCKLKGKRRCEPLGGDVETAKTELKRILGDDVNGKDFDATKATEQSGVDVLRVRDGLFSE
jgi:hypothetical protein